MLKNRILRLLSLSALLGGVALYTTGCDSSSGEGTGDGGVSGGGGSGLGSLGGMFGGGNEAGGGDGTSSGADQTPAEASECQGVCVALVGCLNQVCSLGASQNELSQAVNECLMECGASGTAGDIAAIQEMTANSCAGVQSLIDDAGGCGTEDDGDTPVGNGGSSGGGEGGAGGAGGTGGTGGMGGGGGGDATCQTFCETARRCCAEDPLCEDEDFSDMEMCVTYCAYLPDGMAQCVAQNASSSCQAIDAACEHFFEEDYDEEFF